MSTLPDIYVGFSDQMANKLLSSISYPTTLTFKGSRSSEDDTSFDVAADVFPYDTRGQAPSDPGGEEVTDNIIISLVDAIGIKNSLSEDLLGDTGQAVLSTFGGPLNQETVQLPNGQFKAILSLTQADIKLLEAQGDSRSVDGLGKLWNAIKNAVKKAWKTFKDNLAKFIKEYFKFSVDETRVTIKTQPTLSAAVPMQFKNLLLDVGMTITACIKLGHWRCATINSPKAELESSSFLYDITQKNLVLSGMPRAENMTLNIHIDIFGFSFTIKIDVASIVNKFIAKPEKLIDLSKADLRVDLLNRKMKLDSLWFVNGKGYAEAQVAGTFSPIN